MRKLYSRCEENPNNTHDLLPWELGLFRWGQANLTLADALAEGRNNDLLHRELTSAGNSVAGRVAVRNVEGTVVRIDGTDVRVAVGLKFC